MSETAKHTPGPWELHGGFSEAVVPASEKRRTLGMHVDPKRDLQEHARVICRVEGIATFSSGSERHRSSAWRFTEAEAKANGRLIAAAPDLLDACKWALASHAGIRKSMGGDAEPFSCEAALEAAIAKAEGATP